MEEADFIEREIVKNCSTCAHRVGGSYIHGKCMLSGLYCKMTREYKYNCDANFSGWVERPKSKGIFKRIKNFLFGE